MREEILRLKERVEKSPSSVLFVALAEEYRKNGMFDEAVSVLENGLRQQPNYMSARVALGKIYLEKAMPDKALVEFECVVSAIPDNLFSRRKLAEIFLSKGDNESAREHFEAVLALNPADEDAAATLERLSSNPVPVETDMAFPEPDSEPLSGSAFEPPAVAEYMETESAVPESTAIPEEPELADAALESGFGFVEEIDSEINTESMADVYIGQGLYDKAMNVYERLLDSDKGNRALLQKMSDLKMLTVVVEWVDDKKKASENEQVVKRMNLFMSDIRKRANEVSGEVAGGAR
ncbi:MAG: tetratricopeptide repeat protein [Nitrospirae bacterium]|nr:tetratricopeptide repeat protein [Nitrospirota bacterium]